MTQSPSGAASSVDAQSAPLSTREGDTLLHNIDAFIMLSEETPPAATDGTDALRRELEQALARTEAQRQEAVQQAAHIIAASRDEVQKRERELRQEYEAKLAELQAAHDEVITRLEEQSWVVTAAEERLHDEAARATAALTAEWEAKTARLRQQHEQAIADLGGRLDSAAAAAQAAARQEVAAIARELEAARAEARQHQQHALEQQSLAARAKEKALAAAAAAETAARQEVTMMARELEAARAEARQHQKHAVEQQSLAALAKEQALAAVTADWETRAAALRRQHEEALASLRRDREEALATAQRAQAEALAEAEARRVSEVTSLDRELQAKHSEAHALQQRAVEAQRAVTELETRCVDVLARAEQQELAMLAALEAKLRKGHDLAIAELRGAHERAADAARLEAEGRSAQMRESYESRLAELQAGFTETLSRAEQDAAAAQHALETRLRQEAEHALAGAAAFERTMTEALAAKDEQHAEALRRAAESQAALEASLSAAKAENAHALARLRHEHEEALAAREREHAAALARQEVEKERGAQQAREALAALEQEQQRHEETRRQHEGRLAEQQAALTAAVDAKEKEERAALGALEVHLREEGARMVARLELTSKESMEAARRAHESALAQAVRERNEALAVSAAEWEARLDALRADHSRALAVLHDEQERAVEQARRAADEERAARDREQYETLRLASEERWARLQELHEQGRERYEANLARLEESHAEALAALQRARDQAIATRDAERQAALQTTAELARLRERVALLESGREEPARAGDPPLASVRVAAAVEIEPMVQEASASAERLDVPPPAPVLAVPAAAPRWPVALWATQQPRLRLAAVVVTTMAAVLATYAVARRGGDGDAAATPPAAAVATSVPTAAATAEPVAAPADALRGVLHLDSLPAGAAVTVNGEPRGVTPLQLADLAPGLFVVRFELPGHEAAQEVVPLPATSLRADLQVRLRSLTPARAAVDVVSTPTNAVVVVDGKKAGETPIKALSLPPGRYRIEVTKPGYEPWSSTVRVAAGERAEVHAALQALPARKDVYLEPELDVEPVRISGSFPSYPDKAPKLKSKDSRSVAVTLVVREDGSVGDVQVGESGGGVLDEAVLNVVRGWKFKPPMKSGVPVKAHLTRRFTFRGA